jgi:hypothetical protein
VRGSRKSPEPGDAPIASGASHGSAFPKPNSWSISLSSFTTTTANALGDESENCIKDLKIGLCMEHKPYGAFEANGALFAIGITTYMGFRGVALGKKCERTQVHPALAPVSDGEHHDGAEIPAYVVIADKSQVSESHRIRTR